MFPGGDGTAQPTGQRERCAVRQFGDGQRVWEMRRDRPQSGDDLGGALGAIERDRLRAVGVGYRVQQPGQPGDMVGVGMRQADRADPPKPPAGAPPRNLRPLTAVEQRQLAATAQEQARQPAIRQWHHCPGPEEQQIDHPLIASRSPSSFPRARNFRVPSSGVAPGIAPIHGT